jgi:hypothetical protein
MYQCFYFQVRDLESNILVRFSRKYEILVVLIGPFDLLLEGGHHTMPWDEVSLDVFILDFEMDNLLSRHRVPAFRHPVPRSTYLDSLVPLLLP